MTSHTWLLEEVCRSTNVLVSRPLLPTRWWAACRVWEKILSTKHCQSDSPFIGHSHLCEGHTCARMKSEPNIFITLIRASTNKGSDTGFKAFKGDSGSEQTQFRTNRARKYPHKHKSHILSTHHSAYGPMDLSLGPVWRRGWERMQDFGHPQDQLRVFLLLFFKAGCCHGYSGF